MARRTPYYSPTGERPTVSQLIRDDLAPPHTQGMTQCPRGCRVFFHFVGSVAYNAHMTTHGVS